MSSCCAVHADLRLSRVRCYTLQQHSVLIDTRAAKRTKPTPTTILCHKPQHTTFYDVDVGRRPGLQETLFVLGSALSP